MKYYVLKVPYEEKEQVKSKGAKWDAAIKSWICSEDQLDTFTKWSPYKLTSSSEPYTNPFSEKPAYPKEDLINDNFVILDTETTGLSNNDEVVELSILDNMGNEIYHSLFNPETPISYSAANVSHISMAEVSWAPKFGDEWEKIKEIIGDRYIIAHNITFDKRLMTQTAIRYGATKVECDKLFNNCVDSMDIFQKYAGKMKLQVACDKLGLNINQTHRASDDCVMILYVFDALGNTPVKDREDLFINGYHPPKKEFNIESFRHTYHKSNLTTDNFVNDQEKIFSNAKLSAPIKELDKVRAIIDNAIAKDISIYHVGDYDVDGISSSYIMETGLRRLGAQHFKNILPLRQTDGYGFSVKIADRILAETNKPGLLLTSDNGIAAHDAIQKMKDAGWTVVVTDHHEPVLDEKGNPILPNADIVIDPKAKWDSSDFHTYCGAGIIYQLFDSYDLPPHEKDMLMKDLLSIAAIATIADIVELIEEDKNTNTYYINNWKLVKDGLEEIHKGHMPIGLRALINASNKDMASLSEEDFGYSLVPMLNSPSRLYDDGAYKSLNLLLELDSTAAEKKAVELININEYRKKLIANIEPKLFQYIESKNIQNNFPICVSGKIPEGLIGIIAGDIAEKYKTAAFVFASPDENGIMKGSARTTVDVHIKNLMDDCKDCFITYGGHAGAGGMKTTKSNYQLFREKSQKVIGEKPEYYDTYDYIAKTKDVTYLKDKEKQYAPYGVGHERPKYLIQDFSLDKFHDQRSYMTMGPQKTMMKMQNKYAQAVEFTGSGLQQYHSMKDPEKVDLYGTLGENVFRGVTTTQILVTHIDPPSNVLELDRDEEKENTSNGEKKKEYDEEDISL